MKKNILFLLFICMYINVFAQSNIFVMCNDNTIESFLTSEVDSITFDYLNADGDTMLTAQHQLFWTADSTYRIALSKIDTVLVKQQTITYNSRVFTLTSEHDPYLTYLDSLSFMMSLSTPSYYLPRVGNIVVSDYTCVTFAQGIIAFVDSIKTQQDGYHYYCSKATFDDVFDELFLAGEADANTLRAPQNGMRRVNAVVPAQLWNLNYNKSVPYSGTTTNVDISDEAKLKFSLVKTAEIPLTVQLVVNHDFIASLSFNAHTQGARSGEIPVGSYSGPRIPVPEIPIIWFTPQFHLSVGASVSGSADIQFNSSFYHKDIMSIYYNKLTGWVPSYNPSTSASIDNLSLNMTGSIQVDLIPNFFISICDTGNGIGIGASVGLKGTATFNFDGLEYLHNGSYNAIKDAKFVLSSPQSVEAFAAIDLFFMDPQDFSFPIGDRDVFLKDFYLLPEFSTPTASISSSKTAATITTQVSRNLVIPVQVGLGLYDLNDNEIDNYFTSYSQGTYSLSHMFTGLQADKSYVVYPMVKFCNNVFRASPSKSISIDRLCLESPTENVVFFYDSRDWGSIYCYLWNGSGEYRSWPGGAATSLGDGYYKYVIPAGFSPSNIIWSDGGTTATMSYQTNDLNFVNRALYTLSASAPNPNYDEWGGWPSLPFCSTTSVTEICGE
ncbi:MAG: starch-binding protein [Paludibacteraceae bacterium]|nr:starch-binding protein [Paludibacteraceae bacterium]